MNRVDVRELVGAEAVLATGGFSFGGNAPVVTREAFPASDRRSQERFRCEVRFVGGAGGSALTGRVIDLSPTGLFIVTPVKMPLGKVIHLDFELPTGKVQAVGEVVRAVRDDGVPGFGIRFVRLDAGSAAAIRAAI